MTRGLRFELSTVFYGTSWGLRSTCNAATVAAYVRLNAYDFFVAAFTAFVVFDALLQFTQTSRQKVTRFAMWMTAACMILGRVAWETEVRGRPRVRLARLSRPALTTGPAGTYLDRYAGARPTTASGFSTSYGTASRRWRPTTTS